MYKLSGSNFAFSIIHLLSHMEYVPMIVCGRLVNRQNSCDPANYIYGGQVS